MSSPLSPPDPLVLAANANLAAAEALLAEVRAAAATGHPIAIDASQVTALGQAMVQLLLAAARTAAGTRIVAASDAYRERIDQLGLKELAA